MVNEKHRKENDNEEHINKEHEDLVNQEPNQPINDNNNNENTNENDQNEDFIKEFGPLNIYGLSNWGNIDQSFRDLLVERGPIRDNDVVFPKDDFGRHFSFAHYIQHLSNGEKHDMKWLVYSNALDRVLCF